MWGASPICSGGMPKTGETNQVTVKIEEKNGTAKPIKANINTKSDHTTKQMFCGASRRVKSTAAHACAAYHGPNYVLNGASRGGK
jgi:hypothetical protein